MVRTKAWWRFGTLLAVAVVAGSAFWMSIRPLAPAAAGAADLLRRFGPFAAIMACVLLGAFLCRRVCRVQRLSLLIGMGWLMVAAGALLLFDAACARPAPMIGGLRSAVPLASGVTVGLGMALLATVGQGHLAARRQLFPAIAIVLIVTGVSWAAMWNRETVRRKEDLSRRRVVVQRQFADMLRERTRRFAAWAEGYAHSAQSAAPHEAGKGRKSAEAEFRRISGMTELFWLDRDLRTLRPTSPDADRRMYRQLSEDATALLPRLRAARATHTSVLIGPTQLMPGVPVFLLLVPVTVEDVTGPRILCGVVTAQDLLRPLRDAYSADGCTLTLRIPDRKRGAAHDRMSLPDPVHAAVELQVTLQPGREGALRDDAKLRALRAGLAAGVPGALVLLVGFAVHRRRWRRVSVKSEGGPASDIAASQVCASEASCSAPAALRPPRVLLGESDAVQARVTRIALEQMGCEVDEVTTGRKALEALSRLPYDLLLISPRLPEIGGYEVATAVRRREAGTGRHLPIIALSPAELLSDEIGRSTAGIDDCLVVPVQPLVLRAVIMRCTQSFAYDQTA